jgi:general secretion pathway protein L
VKDSTTEQTMAIALEQRLQQIRGRVQAGPAGKFFRWWIGELKGAMPASWRERLQHALRHTVVTIDDSALALAVDEDRSLRLLETVPLSPDLDWQRRQIEELLEDHDLAEAPRFLALDLGEVLSKELSLPAAAEANLAQVLAFEMDRQTPFKASDVYYDWRIVQRDAAGQLRLQLFVVPRDEVDQAIKAASDRGIGLSGIDVVDGTSSLGLNLLPYSERHRAVNRRARLNYVLAGAVVVLLAAVMTQSLYLRAHQVSELEMAIAAVQGEARDVMRIKEQIEDSSDAAGFLALRRAESPLAIELLADITRLLPDDTYLDRLVIGKESVQLQGKSQNAQRLIELVNESEMLDDAAFRGSTRLDARSGLEIFEVTAQVAGGGG